MAIIKAKSITIRQFSEKNPLIAIVNVNKPSKRGFAGSEKPSLVKLTEDHEFTEGETISMKGCHIEEIPPATPTYEDENGETRNALSWLEITATDYDDDDEDFEEEAEEEEEFEEEAPKAKAKKKKK